MSDSTNSILAFYSPGGLRQLLLRQYGAFLILQSKVGGRFSRFRSNELDVDVGFRREVPIFLTITSSDAQTAIYVDGVLAGAFPQFILSAEDFAGRLVIGSAPSVDGPWPGQVRGLALYESVLDPAQVLAHYQSWREDGQPRISAGERNIAAYLFDEHSGRVIHNQVKSGADLYVPSRYRIAQPVLLQWPWNEYHPGWSYWTDLLANIAGFVPLGFFFNAYFSSALRWKRAAIITIVAGAAVSLAIEVLQASQPTRTSGMTDLITNSLGTAIGALLYARTLARCSVHEPLE